MGLSLSEFMDLEEFVTSDLRTDHLAVGSWVKFGKPDLFALAFVGN